MVDVEALALDITAKLRTVAGISVFDGSVPKSVPEAGGYILPYAVLWLGMPDDPREQTADGRHNDETENLDFQTTVVASNPAACRAVSQAVKQALKNHRAGTGLIKPNPDAFDQKLPIPDTTITPTRYMLPLQWRLITN